MLEECKYVKTNVRTKNYINNESKLESDHVKTNVRTKNYINNESKLESDSDIDLIVIFIFILKNKFKKCNNK